MNEKVWGIFLDHFILKFKLLKTKKSEKKNKNAFLWMNIFEGVVVQLMIATWNDNLFEGKERTSISIIVPVYKNFICAYVIYSVMWAFLRMYVHLIEATSRSSSSWVQHQRIQEIKKIVTLNIFTVIHNTTCFALHNTKK